MGIAISSYIRSRSSGGNLKIGGSTSGVASFLAAKAAEKAAARAVRVETSAPMVVVVRVDWQIMVQVVWVKYGIELLAATVPVYARNISSTQWP
jgi:hypothetical protein